MTPENQAETTGIQADDLPEECDRLLAFIVNLTDQTGIGFPITLNVGGMLVSGRIITRKTFFQKTREQMGKTNYLGGEEIAGKAREFITNIFTIMTDAVPDLAHPEENAPLPKYLHLENARFYSPGGNPRTNGVGGVYWRGRISAVAGYSFGELPLP